MNVEALRPLVCPMGHRRPVVRFFARAFLLPVMLAATWFIAVAGIAGRCQAGVILTAESCLSVQTVGDASSVPPGGDNHGDDDERVFAEQANTLPLGTGALGGGLTFGVPTWALSEMPLSAFSPSVLTWRLEECSIAFPDYPTFDWLRPPQHFSRV